MSPEYFTRTLTIFEAELFCKGLRRREQNEWHRARYTAYYAVAPHCKNFTPDKMGTFPWEESPEEMLSEEEQLKEIEALRERIRAEESMLNSKKMQYGG